MTLTEQWKKGELEDGYYYMQLPNGDIRIITNSLITNCNGVSILAPVPSYEEWRDIEDDLATCDKDLNNVCEQKEELYEENQQLKELLKEIRSLWKGTVCMPDSQEQVRDILTKIDNAIGEKK